MTPPRYIVGNQLVFVTCGAVGRSFRFLPTSDVIELLWYVLALITNRYRVQIHEVVFMGNHFHILLTDVDGLLPDFMRDLNSLISRGLNALRHSTGCNVEKGYNIVTPMDDAKVVDHAVYTLTNPCNADLVARSEHWSSVMSLNLDYGEPRKCKRPTVGLWRAVAKASGSRSAASTGRTKLPDAVDFVLVRPDVMRELSDGDLREIIRAKVRCVESKLIGARKSSGRGVLGMRRASSMVYTDTPPTARERAGTRPRFSGGDEAAHSAALELRRRFEHLYASARDAIDEVFELAAELGSELAKRLAAIELPMGTFLLRRRYGCACALAG